MTLPNKLLRPIHLFTTKHQRPPPHITSNIETHVQNILDYMDPIEHPLESLVPFFTPSLITSTLQDQRNNLELGFRFFIWAMRRKQFRTRTSQDLMVNMICKQNGFDTAWCLFQKLKKDGILIVPQAFTVLIMAYEKLGLSEMALEAFGKMKDFGSLPSTFTYNTVLDLLVRREVVLLALAVYNQMLKCNCAPNQATYAILIGGLCKAGKTKDALQLFDEMTMKGIAPNVVVYTVVVNGLCQAKKIDDARRLLESMKCSTLLPTDVTYRALINGYCKTGRIDEILELIGVWKEEGFVLGVIGYTSLIDGMFRDGRFDQACDWYRKMLEEDIVPNCVTYTIMIKGYMKAGKAEEALGFLNEMADKGLVPNTYCYNTVINGFCDMGLLDQARSLKLEISKDEGFQDSVTYTILICGLCKEGLVKEAQEIFQEMEKLECYPTLITFNALIKGLCKAKKLEDAQMLFYKMEIGRNPSLFLRLSQGAERVLNSASLETLMQSLCESGLVAKAYTLLRKLADSGVMPNLYTYNILINGFCKSGNINAAIKLFKDLQLRGYSPDSVTYGTLVDGLQMVDREEDALKLFYQMERSGCVADLAIYNILMKCFCRKKKFTRAFSLWMMYLGDLPNQDDNTTEPLEYDLDIGNIEKTFRGLLKCGSNNNVGNSSFCRIFIIELVIADMVDEAFKIFKVIKECEIDINGPGYVYLINGLRSRKKFDQALDVFLYTLKIGVILKAPVCNQLIASLHLQDDKEKMLDLVSRMDFAGYDLNIHLPKNTKYLLSKFGYNKNWRWVSKNDKRGYFHKIMKFK